MTISIFEIFFYGVPLVILFSFFVALFLYLSAKIKKKKNPESVTKESLKRRGIILIITSVLAFAVVAFFVGIVILLSAAVAYM